MATKKAAKKAVKKSPAKSLMYIGAYNALPPKKASAKKAVAKKAVKKAPAKKAVKKATAKKAAKKTTAVTGRWTDMRPLSLAKRLQQRKP
ncbi:hypothetical protein [Granulicella mallensis]|uniref:Uncharacterized protein n=1 Tax=Granulicella mallensis TaxID=940614 RepID=A0A7W7ZUI7_9BACT|nr:hypothetical protein [Granulicella mallensis]MBB5066012.1 hypothetical protein [Granulicella mallensis]